MFKRWLKKRRERKFIQDTFALLRYTYPKIGMTSQYALAQSFSELLEQYRETFGDDGFDAFYWQELDHLIARYQYIGSSM